MSVEQREGRFYVYKKIRAGTKVRSLYQRPARQVDFMTEGLRLLKGQCSRLDPADFPLRDHSLAEHVLRRHAALVADLVQASLLLLGFRNHKNEWRIRQGACNTLLSLGAPCYVTPSSFKMESIAREIATKPPHTWRCVQSLDEKEASADFRFLRDEAARLLSDCLALPEAAIAQKALDDRLASLSVLWSVTEGAAHFAALRLARAIAQDNPTAERAVLMSMDQMRLDLGYEEAPPSLRLLIDQAALAWAQHRAILLVTPPHADRPTLKRLALAEARLARALESVERTRGLLSRSKAMRNRAASLLDGRPPLRGSQESPSEYEEIPLSTKRLGRNAFYHVHPREEKKREAYAAQQEAKQQESDYFADLAAVLKG